MGILGGLGVCDSHFFVMSSMFLFSCSSCISCFTFLSCSPDFQLFTSLARFLLTIFEDLDCIKIHFAEGLFVFPQRTTWLMVVLEKKKEFSV